MGGDMAVPGVDTVIGGVLYHVKVALDILQNIIKVLDFRP